MLMSADVAPVAPAVAIISVEMLVTAAIGIKVPMTAADTEYVPVGEEDPISVVHFAINVKGGISIFISLARPPTRWPDGKSSPRRQFPGRSSRTVGCTSLRNWSASWTR